MGILEHIKILFFLVIMSFSMSSLQASHEEAKTVTHEERKEEISKRENEIQEKKREIEQLESEKRYTEAQEKGKTLEKLLDTHINELRKFSIDFPSERAEANIQEGKAEQEKTVIQEKINRYSQELATEGTKIPAEVSVPLEPDVVFILSDLNKTPGSSRFKDSLKNFYNEFKAKVYELPVIGNPKKAIEVREKLNGIYEASGNLERQLRNLKKLGDLGITQAQRIGESAAQIQEQVNAVENYVKQLEAVNNRIQYNELGATNEKLKLQAEALKSIVLKTNTRLYNFEAGLTPIRESINQEGPPTQEVDSINKNIDEISENIRSTMSTLLNQPAPKGSVISEEQGYD